MLCNTHLGSLRETEKVFVRGESGFLMTEWLGQNLDELCAGVWALKPF